MRNMKRSFIIAILAATACVFCSCGTNADEETDSETGSDGLSYSLKEDGSAYVCDGLGEATDKELVIGSVHEGLPVTAIGEWAFYGGEFTSVTIPDSVTEIGDGAFSTCSYITEITLPDGVTEISESAFHSCSSLKKVTLGEGVTSIAPMAFENCVSLTDINVSDGITDIGTMAFGGCEKLSSFTIPSSLTKISSHMFFECLRLSEVIVPVSVTEIGKSAFYGCQSLTHVYYEGSEADLEGLSIEEANDEFKDNLYVYSESSPAETENEEISGYWYYTESGRTEIWR